MAPVRPVQPVIRFCAIISRHPSARTWAEELIRDHWGPLAVRSETIDFEASGYYTDSMGSDLRHHLVAIEGTADPAGLADWKHQTNEWETLYASQARHPDARPLNLDPGYITQAKFVLATTKDRDHRIYLRDGMYAEVTLSYVGKQWRQHRWTYPSYRTAEVADFAMRCRQNLRTLIARESAE